MNYATFLVLATTAAMQPSFAAGQSCGTGRQAQSPSAQAAFASGLSAYGAQCWNDAAARFHDSYKHQPRALTAYMLAATYARLARPDETYTYGLVALTHAPSLPGPYIQDARALVLWARAERHVRSRTVIRITQSHGGQSNGREIVGDAAEAQQHQAEADAGAAELAAVGISKEQLQLELWYADVANSTSGPDAIARLLSGSDENLVPVPVVSIPEAPK